MVGYIYFLLVLYMIRVRKTQQIVQKFKPKTYSLVKSTFFSSDYAATPRGTKAQLLYYYYFILVAHGMGLNSS